MSQPTSMHQVLNYWFEYCPSNAVLSQLPNLNDSFDRWFGGKEDTIQKTLWNSVSSEAETWADTHEGQLARVILYDQITRGCFRGTAKAFAFDERALFWANRFLESIRTSEMALSSPNCLSHHFMVLICLSHSENKETQERSLHLSQQFAQEVLAQTWLSDKVKQQLAQVYPEAQQHYKVIQHLGRFPHRNRVLNRQSTLEEEQFLQGDLPQWMYSQQRSL
jgi:uncharacterized protein (DUF924 family)